MGHTPLGYRIENSYAVIDEEAAERVRGLFRFYLEGDALAVAAQKTGIVSSHGGIGRILRNQHYLGDEYYPALIDKDTFDKAEEGRMRRAASLGRIRDPKTPEAIPIPLAFRSKPAEQEFEDPFRQAEYAYSLIESEG